MNRLDFVFIEQILHLRAIAYLAKHVRKQRDTVDRDFDAVIVSTLFGAFLGAGGADDACGKKVTFAVSENLHKVDQQFPAAIGTARKHVLVRDVGLDYLAVCQFGFEIKHF